MYTYVDHDRLDEYIAEQYESYMAQNCTCASSDKECDCMTLSEFEDDHMYVLEQSYLSSLDLDLNLEELSRCLDY